MYKHFIKIGIYFLSFCSFLITGLVGFYYYTINQPLYFKTDTFMVKPGETLHSITYRLFHEGVVNDPYTLRIKANIDNIGTKIRAGEYRFQDGITISDFLEKLVNGEGLIGIKITIIEGWSFRRMRQALKNEKKLIQITKNWSDQKIMKELGHPNLHPEGQFYPDTYQYRYGDSDLSILKAAFSLMQKKLDFVWKNRSRNLTLNSPYETLIVASIIEKETHFSLERAKIAGVFFNRLKQGMKLQADSTIIYGLGDQYDGNITRKHLESDTPYNTYTRPGLPPTPISLPSLNSLLAVVNPEETDLYYFVAKMDGGHQFSRTLKEHNAAVKRYTLNK